MLTARALDVRARRAADFAGSYVPLDAGDDVCAFRRGEGVAVAVPLGPGASKEAAELGAGWVDVLPEYASGLFVRRDA